MAENGLGIKRSSKTAFEYYEKACDMESDIGCYNVGLSYEYGKWVQKDKERSIFFYQKGCKMGSGDACRELKRSA
jgi:TPR repeat protein